jgi:hypothetical protein
MLCSWILALGIAPGQTLQAPPPVQAPTQEVDDLADLVGKEVVVSLGMNGLVVHGTLTRVGHQFITVAAVSRRAKDSTRHRTLINRLHIVTIECLDSSGQ